MTDSSPEKRSLDGRTITLIVVGIVLTLAVGLGIGMGLSGSLGSAENEPEVAQLATVATPSETPQPTATPELPTPIIITQPPTETPTPSITPSPTNTPTPSQTPTPTETPTPTPTPTAVGPQVRALEDAGLFAGPGGSFGRIGFFVPTGTTVVALGISEDGTWLHVVDPFSREGWVVARFFEYRTGSPDALAFSDFITEAKFTPSPVPPGAVAQPGNTPTPGGPTAVPPQTSAVAYWNFNPGSASGNGDGTWRADLTMRVPGGGTYDFQLGAELVDVSYLREDANGFDIYSLALDGLGCSAAFVRDLIVLQNGAQMVVQNEFTRQPGPIYIVHDCG